MSEYENTESMQRIYELFKSGEIETLLGMYSDRHLSEKPKVENVSLGG